MITLIIEKVIFLSKLTKIKICKQKFTKSKIKVAKTKQEKSLLVLMNVHI